MTISVSKNYSILSLVVFLFGISASFGSPQPDEIENKTEAMSNAPGNSSGSHTSSAPLEDCALDPSPTTLTPCPFINSMIREGKIGRDKTTVQELVENAHRFYGIDRSLMTTLANARAERGSSEIIIKKLLDTSLAPAHHGSLARGDDDLSVVDQDKLNQFRSDTNFGSDVNTDAGPQRTVSFKQLKRFQQYCWNKSNMSISDRLPARGEAKLLWDLFGAYRIRQEDGTEALPYQIVDRFLRDNALPKEFNKNQTDPTTRCSLLRSILSQAFMSLD